MSNDSNVLVEITPTILGSSSNTTPPIARCDNPIATCDPPEATCDPPEATCDPPEATCESPVSPVVPCISTPAVPVTVNKKEHSIPHPKKPLTIKQLAALERGRQKLAEKRRLLRETVRLQQQAAIPETIPEEKYETEEYQTPIVRYGVLNWVTCTIV